MTQRERQIIELIDSNPMISQQEIADRLGITRSSVAVHISNLIKKGIIAGKGYVLTPESYVVVVGGLNVDIGGQSFSELVPADSNPGAVSVSMGGVGRNIAHNLSLMGVNVKLLTAYGDDANGQQAGMACTRLGIDMSYAQQISGAVTSTYLYLADPKGEMALAVSDMRICDRITPEYLAQNMSLLQNARVVIADTNIPEASLEFLVNNCTAPVFIDPVSTKKAEKLRSILPKIHTLKPNRLEAELLSGVPIRSNEDVKAAADVLLAAGIQRVFISLGADGVYAATAQQQLHLPNMPVNPVNTTGCGDAFMAALVWAWLEDLDLRHTAAAGLAAAAIAMEANETINPAMNEETLKEKIKI